MSAIKTIIEAVRRRAACLAILIALCAGNAPVLAAETSTPAQLNSIATDGKTYAAKFAVSITRANSTTQVGAVNVNEAVEITGFLYPDPAHVNKQADVFVVMRNANGFFMKNQSGAFVPWNATVATLVPFQEGVTLSAEYSVPVYSGVFASASTERVFVGYMAKGLSGLIYTPVPQSFDVQLSAAPINPLTFYSDNIENVLIQKRCIACHVTGGLAKDSRLLYDRSSSTSTANNYNTLRNLVSNQSNPVTYVLSKVTGGNNHGGGAQLSPGSSDYNALSAFLQLVSGSTVPTVTEAGSFFDGVSLQTRVETLRRAAITVAGRAPTPAEIAAVSAGDENTLRTTLRGLLSGPGFHKFLTEGANDRLLTQDVPASAVIEPSIPTHLKLAQYLYQMQVDNLAKGLTQTQANALYNNYYYTVTEYATRRSVEEQVAYVVDNDKPYSEILTGDYMMMTPRMNFLLDGNAVFKNPDDMYEFAPGKIGTYYSLSNVIWSPIPNKGALVTGFRGGPTTYPHTGILNNPAFLVRYPSTPTNRNRARARWTLLNFMDIDIEKSTQRPIDPAALADTNNPTMNNPNCYACHERMDPVAAAFQNYFDHGHYLYYGTDSLDGFYKKPPDGSYTPYVRNDKWYRDMRPAGLLGQPISDSGEPLRALANLIVQDPAFARATVKFWWPSVMNSSVLLAPAVSTDSDYQDKLAAYQAQATSIEQFAAKFATTMNLKDLLADMMMSPWFRAEGNLAASRSNASVLAGLGTEKLLTPERLQRKTTALTGFTWKLTTFPRYEGRFQSGLYDDYRTTYGGIDSVNVVERIRDITPLMTAVATTAALESACPIVLREFILPDTKRKLFSGTSDIVTPLTEGATLQTPASSSATQWTELTLNVQLTAGSKQLALSLGNPYCDWDGTNCRTQRVLYIDNFQVRAPGSSSFTMHEFAPNVTYRSGCGPSGTNDAKTTGCTLTLPYTAASAGTYQVKARVAAVQAGTAAVQAVLAVWDTATPLASTSNGARAIKNKLADLHQILHGKTYAIDSPEITASYKLFVDTWQAKYNANSSTSLTFPNQCNWSQDWNFLDGLGFTGTVRSVAPAGNFYQWNTTEINAFLDPYIVDPLYVKQSWIVVMTYMLTHYNYLYE